jgi:hypothetical protein
MRARARDQQLAPPVRTSGWSALAWRPAGRAPPSRRAPPRQADPPRRSEERPATVRQLFDGSDHPNSDSLQRRRSRARSTDLASMPSVPQEADSGATPAAPAVIAYPGRRSPGCSHFPRHWRGPRVNPGRGGGRRISPQAIGGAQCHRRDDGSKWGSPRVGGLQACSPRVGLVGSPGEEVPGALQDVSFRSQSLHHKLFNLPCLLTSVPSSRRHADTGVLSLASLKCLALSARVVPSEPRPQPPCAEPLPVQVVEGWSWPLWWRNRAHRPRHR